MTAPEPAQPPGERPVSAAPDTLPPDALPMPVFLEFLRRLHDGPPQHAAAVRVAVAIWQQAVERGDGAQARDAVALVRAELDRLLDGLTALQETGRRWSGRRSPTHEELAAAAAAAGAWEATRALPRRSGSELERGVGGRGSPRP
jgi:hypothetical protein